MRKSFLKKAMTSTCVLALTLFTLSCSNDDDNNNPNNTPPNTTQNNQMAFDIAGDVTGSKTGSSSIVTVENANNTYMISNHDGTSFDTQTFSLVFYKAFSDNTLANPSPGTYPIANVGHLIDQDGFWAVYTDTQTGEDYGSGNLSGTLTITSNTNNQLKGTFEFSAENLSGTKTITVTNGTFSAAID
ncbi:MAG: hypothetical protein GYB39_05320 [Algicola sp.]|nr:hypothetical protein [Algicola sp.]